MTQTTHSLALNKRKRRLTWLLLLLWAMTSYGPAFFARSLSFEVRGWPFHFWMAAQGSFLVFLAMVVLYAWLMNRWGRELRNEEAKANPYSH